MKEEYGIVADKARETFLKIRELRKTLPKYTSAQRKELEDKIKASQDEWWEEVKEYMRKE
jgi:hypothetical protein